jgi:hypothetical protein
VTATRRLWGRLICGCIVRPMVEGYFINKGDTADVGYCAKVLERQLHCPLILTQQHPSHSQRSEESRLLRGSNWMFIVIFHCLQTRPSPTNIEQLRGGHPSKGFMPNMRRITIVQVLHVNPRTVPFITSKPTTSLDGYCAMSCGGECTSKQLKPSRHGDDEDERALINGAWGDYYRHWDKTGKFG